METTMNTNTMTMINALSMVKGHQFVGVVMTTAVKMNKTGNPYYGRLTKRVKASMSFNYNYEKAVNNRLEREGKEPNFDGGKLPWGTWSVYNKFISHKGELYVRLYEIPTNVPQVVYLLDGVEVSEVEMAQIRPYLPTRKASAKQEDAGLVEEKQVMPKAVNVANIDSLSICGVIYTR